MLLIRCLIICFTAATCTGTLWAQRPKIAVVLSGGGAKGLAHVGILKAIDSAGLNIDIVTGTSMGAVVGGLYACGYNADTLMTMARSIQWDQLLTNTASMQNMVMDEKEEYNRYAVELPYINNKFRLPTGLLESEELWLKLSELYYPAFAINDFDSLPRRFRCIAADMASGKAYVFREGNLPYAVRSSITIPSFFTAVNYKNMKLVDGGVIRNFPVTDAKAMGADLVIGSNVTEGFMPAKNIQNVIQVVMQVAFLKNDADLSMQQSLCNVYIHHPLDEYTMGSFGSAQSIIDEGYRTGLAYYPVFKKMADSLNAIYGMDTLVVRLPQPPPQLIRNYSVNGIIETDTQFFYQKMQFEAGKRYQPEAISEMIRNAFGTRYYNRIRYQLKKAGKDSSDIIFDVEESPTTYFKPALHYNQFTGISLLANITSRDFFFPFSRSMATINLGENMRGRASHTQNFGTRKNFSVESGTVLELIQMKRYNASKEFIGSFRQFNAHVEGGLSYSMNRANQAGTYIRLERIYFGPRLETRLDLRGYLQQLIGGVFYSHNTLLNPSYPVKGVKLRAEGQYTFSQRNRIRIFNREQQITGTTDSSRFGFEPYFTLRLQSETYLPLFPRFTFFTHSQAGIHLHYKQYLTNDFVVGGLNRTLRNQVLFAGLDETTVSTGSVAAVQLGLRYEMFSNLFLLARNSLGSYGFISNNYGFTKPRWLSGYALSMGYNFVLGPLELSVMYSDQTKKVLPYFNLGISF